jgi:DNA-3-methyladenine glycosylase II
MAGFRVQDWGMDFTIEPVGPFELHRLANFGFGDRINPSWDGCMRMAFVGDDLTSAIGVEVRQPAPDRVEVAAQVVGQADEAAVRRQVARMLSLDHDGNAFIAVGRRDPAIGKLQAAAPGLRPPLFHSPYEAAAWSILSARRSAKQASGIRAAMSQRYGTAFTLAGNEVAAFPTPAELRAITAHPGIEPTRLARLHAVADAALRGDLHVQHLRDIGPEQALVELQRISGIGPFYAALIVVRATGFADVAAVEESRALAIAGDLYELGRPMTADEMRAKAKGWSPFATWCIVHIRAVGSLADGH